MDYRVLSGASVKSLEEQVMDLAREGYIPQGGLAIAYATGTSNLVGNGIISAPLFSQAMVLVGPVKALQSATEGTTAPDRDEWITSRLKEYSQYWDENKQRYIIDKDWMPTRDELLADIEKSYDFDHRGEK